MVDIDYIMGLLDWNNDVAEQERGIMLARDVKCFCAFFNQDVTLTEKMFGIIVRELYRKDQTTN